jgi:sulfatase modifying factor 1
VLFASCAMAGAACCMAIPKGREFSNSLGMRLVRIEPGTFGMGFEGQPLPKEVAGKPHRANGDFDERPSHEVQITRAFYMGACEVTNAQYEQFDPKHAALRGKLGFSKEDDEAVVFVSWQEATRFCRWLSKREGLPYRLPTEAEWEYACRAGTTTPYHTGPALPEAFHRNQRQSWYPDPHMSKAGEVVPLTVGVTPPNAWGLLDMHGNVEEWCADWYGPYEPQGQVDPVGRRDGEFRVTRGGSHGTEVFYLRSANRSGALPEERSWYIGLRVVIGERPKTKPLPVCERPPNACGVKQGVPRATDVRPGPGGRRFAGPREYVRIPPDSDGPLFSRHNHVPALCECPNGELLAAWYSCVEEPGREVSLAASRLRAGESEWEPASLFWDAPDRTETSNAFLVTENDTIIHFIGMSAAATWGSTCTVLRTSRDNGETWSKARITNPEHGPRNMPIDGVIRTRDGALVLPCDAVSVGNGGTAVHVSTDGGKTWSDPGGKTAGIHAGLAELRDGRLLAFGRGDSIEGRMPKSVSADRGRTWTYLASEFPPISSGQRLRLLRLREGPLLLCSFGESGLFAALSYDEGETWPVKRLVTDGGAERRVPTTDGVPFTLSATQAEPRGYLSCIQSRSGLIHLITSRNHYAFNLAWVEGK